MRVQHLIITILFFTIVAIGCKNGNKGSEQGSPTTQETTDTTTYSVNTTFHDFGVISAGDIVGYTYTITNTGEYNLHIKNVKTDCACTQIEVEKMVVTPGESSKIDIEFNSAGRSGVQIKEFSIFANVKEERIKLYFTTDVN